MATRRQAGFGLFGVTLLWGGTFVWMKQALNAAQVEISFYGASAVVGIMIGFRFTLAALLLLFFSEQGRRSLVSKEDWNGGLIIGVLMLLGYGIQMVGLDTITPSVSAFLTSLYVVFTAILGVKFSNHKLTRIIIFGAGLATFGAGFIDGPPHLVWGWGEVLTVFSALFFAMHILATDRITTRLNPLRVSMTSFLVVGISATLIGLFFARDFDIILVAFKEGVIFPLILLGLLGTLLCLVMLNTYQRYFHPTHAAIIYAFEPVWATLYSINVGLVEVSGWLIFGGVSILIGNLFVEFEAGKIGKTESE